MKSIGESILRTKSYNFAIQIIKTHKVIVSEQHEYVLSKQILRSGTAIGALIKEAEFAQSKADFISKLNIALKESNETEYWLMLLRDTDCISKLPADELIANNKELISLLVSFIKTTKLNLVKK